MKSTYTYLSLFILLCSTWACETPQTEKADLILFNGNIHTVDTLHPKVEAIACKGDRIIALGSNKDIEAYTKADTRRIDLEGRFAMPGFIEGHGHFSNLGKSLQNLNFLKSKNWDDIVTQVTQRAEELSPGEWIEGRGWHQEKWDKRPQGAVHGYPLHDDLSALTPDNPVILYHASGHSLYANAKAMALAGVSVETPNPAGGEIVRTSDGQAIGVFEERAMRIIQQAYMAYRDSIPEEQRLARWQEGIALAEAECLRYGVTSFQDAGSTFTEIDRYHAMAEANELDVRLWAMVRHSSAQMIGRLDPFPIIDAGDHFFTSRAIKSEVDGALGAFGAWLLRAYNDKPNFVGQNTTTIEEVEKIAQLARQHDLQLCVHAIGDRANREVLNIFERALGENAQSDHRWRIEHAQHLDPADIPRFQELKTIASMQGIHCTSDAPFVVDRLGEERARVGAYPWRSLLDADVVIANGTDAPVEDLSPFECLYASVTRKRSDNGFEFFPQQRMTREEAIYSYTLGNAFAAFEEQDKGSLEVGKLADIVVLSNDLMNCEDSAILDTKVLLTIIGGQLKYEKE